MRVFISNKYHKQLFSILMEDDIGIDNLTDMIKVSKRTVKNWKGRKTTIPLPFFKKLVEISGLSIPTTEYKVMDTYWYTREAGKLGGKARIERYGNFGTPEGRKKGGIRSVKIQSKKDGRDMTGFRTAKDFKIPSRGEMFSEFMGILFGDGHLARYQVSIATNSQTDIEHARYICKIIHSLFGIHPQMKKRRHQNAIDIVVSSIKLVQYLHSEGMPLGNKISNGITVPKWIKKNKKYQGAFIRGLFDTDGCIYLDRHRSGEKEYRHLGWTITSYADKLVIDIQEMLRNMGYLPTNQSSQRSVYLRRQVEIRRYFKEIGSSNSKHIKRYEQFTGEVA